jgi:hypothetical protein
MERTAASACMERIWLTLNSRLVDLRDASTYTPSFNGKRFLLEVSFQSGFQM